MTDQKTLRVTVVDQYGFRALTIERGTPVTVRAGRRVLFTTPQTLPRSGEWFNDALTALYESYPAVYAGQADQ